MGGQGGPDHGRASTPQLFGLLPSGPVGRAPKAPQVGPRKKVPGLGGVSGGQRGRGLGQERDPLASCWAQSGFGPSERGTRSAVSGFSALRPLAWARPAVTGAARGS